MCGIAGILNRNIASGSDIHVRRMLELLIHRGPDDFGIFSDSHICLGHRRLSILDLSPLGHQPMKSDNKSVLVFNGEIYNHNDLRQELIKAGFSFKSRTDTEVLLYGHQFWGDEIVNKLKGFFAFAIRDAENQRLFCARDPFGKKPFYYFWNGQQFVFASEIEALVAGLDTRPNLNYNELSHYLLMGYYPSEMSAYESINKLKPGHCLSIDIKNFEFRQWTYFEPQFCLDQGKTNSCGDKEITKSCGGLLDSAVKRRLESDVPIGMLLSGGVDSSLTTLIAAEHFPSMLKTFTATFRGTKFDEGAYSRQVANKVKSEHHEISITVENLPGILPQLIKAYGEPYGDYSAIPTFLIFQAIKPHVTVALTGDGGDEVFSGYKDTKVFLFRKQFLPYFGFTEKLSGLLSEQMIYNRYRRFRELGHALIAMRSNGADAFYSLKREGWTYLWRKKLMRPEAWKLTNEYEVENRVKQQFINSGSNDMERYLNQNLERLTEDFLVKIDRASMAHSVEARCPMLDLDLFAYVSKLNYLSLLQNKEIKSIPKELLSYRMGSNFARRTKKGFTPPLSEWFRTKKYSKWLEERLTKKDSLVYSLFNPNDIRWMINQHCNGQNHTERLWILLFLNEWHTCFFNESHFSS